MEYHETFYDSVLGGEEPMYGEKPVYGEPMYGEPMYGEPIYGGNNPYSIEGELIKSEPDPDVIGGYVGRRVGGASGYRDYSAGALVISGYDAYTTGGNDIVDATGVDGGLGFIVHAVIEYVMLLIEIAINIAMKLIEEQLRANDALKIKPGGIGLVLDTNDEPFAIVSNVGAVDAPKFDIKAFPGKERHPAFRKITDAASYAEFIAPPEMQEECVAKYKMQYPTIAMCLKLNLKPLEELKKAVNGGESLRQRTIMIRDVISNVIKQAATSHPDLIETLKEFGVDLSRPDTLDKILNNPEMEAGWQDAQRKARGFLANITKGSFLNSLFKTRGKVVAREDDVEGTAGGINGGFDDIPGELPEIEIIDEPIDELSTEPYGWLDALGVPNVLDSNNTQYSHSFISNDLTQPVIGAASTVGGCACIAGAYEGAVSAVSAVGAVSAVSAVGAVSATGAYEGGFIEIMIVMSIVMMLLVILFYGTLGTIAYKSMQAAIFNTPSDIVDKMEVGKSLDVYYEHISDDEYNNPSSRAEMMIGTITKLDEKNKLSYKEANAKNFKYLGNVTKDIEEGKLPNFVWKTINEKKDGKNEPIEIVTMTFNLASAKNAVDIEVNKALSKFLADGNVVHIKDAVPGIVRTIFSEMSANIQKMIPGDIVRTDQMLEDIVMPFIDGLLEKAMTSDVSVEFDKWLNETLVPYMDNIQKGATKLTEMKDKVKETASNAWTSVKSIFGKGEEDAFVEMLRNVLREMGHDETMIEKVCDRMHAKMHEQLALIESDQSGSSLVESVAGGNELSAYFN